jgi:hypothetical protein
MKFLLELGVVASDVGDAIGEKVESFDLDSNRTALPSGLLFGFLLIALKSKGLFTHRAR